ncbi:MAG TPA: hypothetical protein VJH05_00865 [Candidatus Paceibacterota bacterium]
MALDQKEQEIIKRYMDITEDVQKALFATTTSDAIFEVGKKHGLAIDKMGELSDETGLVMLGMTKPSEYIKNLEKRLGVEAIKAKEIAEDINQKVFSPIRESLKKIHGIIKEPVQPSVEPLRKVSEKIPDNLPVEVTPPTIPPSPLRREEGVEGVGGQEGTRGDISKKVDQILKNHDALKQARKHIMPEQPENIKVGEIAKPVEPKVDIKPEISGRITIPPTFNQTSGFDKEKPNVEKPSIPDIFLRRIPTEEKPKIVPDFVPPKEEPIPQSSKEAKTILNKSLNNDIYKESIQ